MKQTVEEAAKKARMASAETLTTYGTHRSLDDFTYLSHCRSYSWCNLWISK